MTLATLKNYRLQTIYNYFLGERPIKEGLAIEKECSYSSSSDKSYYVIAFVKYNSQEEGVEVEVCGTRILDVQDDEFMIFKHLVQLGKDIIELEYKEKGE